jgi:hypothetical protein
MIRGESGGGAKTATREATLRGHGLFHRASIGSGPTVRLKPQDAATETTKRVLYEFAYRSEVGCAPMRRPSRQHRVSVSIFACTALWLLLPVYVSSAQDAPPWPDRGEIEHFLKKAKVTARRKIGTGVTHPEKVTLELDRAVREAVFKTIDEKFDNWRNEVAAYELDKLLGIGMVPPTVERSVGGSSGSLQLWVTGSTMDKYDGSFPDIERWRDQVSVMWLFDDLIANVDRHLNNAMVSPEHRLMLIDHSRSFRDSEELRNDLNANVTGTNGRLWVVEYDQNRQRFPTRYPRSLIERLRSLTDKEIKDAIDRHVWGWTQKLVLERRKRILGRVESMGP